MSIVLLLVICPEAAGRGFKRWRSNRLELPFGDEVAGEARGFSSVTT
jgi:hypothetical protein